MPYASEILGVYQPLIGWKSKQKIDRVKEGVNNDKNLLVSRLGRSLDSSANITIGDDCTLSITNGGLRPAGFESSKLIDHSSIVLREISALLQGLRGIPEDPATWKRLVSQETLTSILNNQVLTHYNALLSETCESGTADGSIVGLTRIEEQDFLRDEKQREIINQVNEETITSGAIKLLLENERVKELNSIFYTQHNSNAQGDFFQAASTADIDFSDPYLTFDPKKDVKDVSLSPLGVVHLFRQYFFELDTFLGTPTGHVWLSPGSTVELIEISTRKTTTEKTIETFSESIVKSERSIVNQDDISNAIKQENRDDLKLGVTSTVNQSWATGNASATASLNMDKTQQVAREDTHKKMRQQSEKISTELRQSYKSTFRTITEVTDTSSKRYVLTNTTNKLINYELRRKMRQVGVQVQDIGSYLCWETFIDEPEPGDDLGLASLVHIAQPTDLLPPPDPTEVHYPSVRVVPFQANAVWNFGKSRQRQKFVILSLIDPPPAPEGFEVVKETGIFPVYQMSASGEKFYGVWRFGGQFTSSGQITIGVVIDPNQDGLSWDERVDFVVGGALRYTPTAQKKAEIDAINQKKKADGVAADEENKRKAEVAFKQAAKERIEAAGSVVKRNFEDLREEERIIVYRRLISSLMTSYQYQYADERSRHILSELINSIFDIDKMLYFVAPEWWKPRDHAKFLSQYDLQNKLSDSLVTWSDNRPRRDNYLITDKSAPAAMGSSLGWLLQLDGDSMRNAFLNAPWVKAVIPVRPGKEQAALNWLQNVAVEGSEGLDATYAAPKDELKKIRIRLGIDANGTVKIKDAINYLCLELADKHAESNSVKTFPEVEINDDNKVNATPIDKVYEHGFYPLKGGFRANPTDSEPDPNNKDRNFQVFDQWMEILPTDQVAPVEVKYDPITGRQIPV